MPCLTNQNLSEQQKVDQKSALARLRAALAAGTVSVVVGRNGGFALKGWQEGERSGVSDLCAYRALANAPEMRRAVMRAEALAGVKVSMAGIMRGVHSHDGGVTWGAH